MACLVMLAYAKKTEVTKSIRWHERSLIWDDFPIINNIPGDYHAMVYSDIQYEGSREDQFLHIYAQMIPHRSGRVIKDDTDTEQLLIHEQNHFNITEYHARLFRKEVVEIGREKLTNSTLKSLGKKYLEQIGAMQDRYDRESKHNIEWPAQRYWELHIAGLLRETAYYTNQDLYTYQAFLGGSTKWFRQLYYTIDGEVLASYPENLENSGYGEIYNIERMPDSTIVKYYQNGKLTNGGYFEAAKCIITFPKVNTREVLLFDADNKPYSNKTEAHITRTVMDAEGNITRTYYDDNRKQISVEGVYTLKGVWDASKKSMHSSYYNKDGIAAMRRGTFQELRILDSNKVSTKIAYFNRDGKPMRDKFFVSIYEYEYDSNFMLSTLKLYDVDGKYAIGLEGYNAIYDYDARGNIKSMAYFDELGSKTSNIEGIHKYTYTYDQYGNSTDMRKFNIRDLPTKGADDFHQFVNLYDSLGRTTFNAKYYPDYVLMFNDNKSGAATYEYVGDTIINVKNVDVYGEDGVNDLGILLTKLFIDDKKQTIREEFYGSDGAWAKTEDEVVSYTYKYDERGNQTETAAFDSLGKLRAWQEDVAITRWEYDENNNKSKTTYFTVDNKLANALYVTTYNVFKYDENSNLIERTNFDKKMNPSLIDGAFRTTSILNRFGKDSIVMMYDVKNNLLSNAGIIKYTYNSRGVLLSEANFNPNNQAALNELGIHKTVYVHDKYDRYIGFTYFGKNGERINSIEGYASMEMKLNNSAFVSTYSYYNDKKNPVLGPDGFHKVENYYNNMDEVVRTSTYGSDNKLLNNANGIADYVYQIDKSGRTVRISLYDSEGNLTENASGIAEYIYTPSLNGLFYPEKQLNAKGEEVAEEVL